MTMNLGFTGYLFEKYHFPHSWGAEREMDGGSVKTRHVKVGKKLDDGTVEILSGLNAGEEVVIE